MDRGKARPSGASLWRKQVLPLGTIDYKGRKITFSREYLSSLVKAFGDKAYDVVPFQFADAANSHSNAPEQRRGTVRDLELTDDGLDIIVEAGQDAAKHLAEYPDLGVSARIVEAYDRADGKFFPAAIQHVLGTLDPRITGLRPWQAIDAANDDGDVLDLTGEQYTVPTPPAPTVTVSGTGGAGGSTTFTALGGGGGGGWYDNGSPLTFTSTASQQQTPTGTPTEDTHMAFTADQEARLAKLLDLPDDKFERVLAVADTEPAAEGEDQLSDEELQALLASLPDGEGDESTEGDSGEDDSKDAAATDEKVPVGASLSTEAQAAIDLANSRAEENALELARVTAALDDASYAQERRDFSHEFGIPPRIVDLAKPLLRGTGHVVELANGSNVDAGAIVRKVFREIGQTVKMLDLSGEMGSPLDGGRDAERAAEEQAAKDRHEMVGAVRRMTGI
jgi:hypothetical protein